MTPTPVDLVTFYVARLDELEAHAEASIAGDVDHLHSLTCPGCQHKLYLGVTDPARVLADVAARRRVVRLLVDAASAQGGLRIREDPIHQSFARALALSIRHLATAFRDHPDYDPAWG